MRPGEELRAHEEDCPKNLVPCPEATCEEKVPVGEVLDHMQAKEHVYRGGIYTGNHMVSRINVNTFNGPNNDRTTRPAFMMLNDKVFAFQMSRMEGIWYTWVEFYGSKSENEKKQYEAS